MALAFPGLSQMCRPSPVASAIAVLLSFAMSSGICSAGAPVSGEPLRVTENGGIGLLSSPNAYSSVPLGAARVSDGARPDLFLNSAHGVTKATYLFKYLRDNTD